jgi:hypothetical protein
MSIVSNFIDRGPWDRTVGLVRRPTCAGTAVPVRRRMQ